ncbi:hypothetical protein ACFWMH_27440 [Streptomyces tendae]|uniref:hypothetical protein n=1 Tax=Streptomyces tendae TaxID=1932 RepID=UPI00364DFBFA
MTLTPAALLARNVAAEREIFAREAQYAAELMKQIADNPESAVVGGDLTRLSQRVTELVRRAAAIKASAEAVELMNVDSNPQEER